MRKVVLIGAGRSSSSLIKYFLENSSRENWMIIVADVSEEQAKLRTGSHPAAEAVRFDINNEAERVNLISRADIVISLLPASMHLPVAVECLRQKKNLVTASYVSGEMQELDEAAKLSGVLLLNECGLDPGIDHMSAMKIIDDVHSKNGIIMSFRSYTGGLVAPESNDNPWGYKFSWNPRNVILAGSGTAKFIDEGKYKYIPYNRLFSEIENIEIENSGNYDGYANRDSLSYRKLYNLENIPTMIRGTLRQSGYCRAWNVFVQLGLTDDSYKIDGSESMSYSQLVNSFLPSHVKGNNTEERLADFMKCKADSDEIKLIKWTGILEDTPVNLKDASPAQILQHLLEEKWKLKPEDKDMIVMQHRFEYIADAKKRIHKSSLVVKGDNNIYTAMAKTVGLPVAIAAKLILNGKISLTGVHIPVKKEIYDPVLNELETYGLKFDEYIS